MATRRNYIHYNSVRIDSTDRILERRCRFAYFHWENAQLEARMVTEPRVRELTDAELLVLTTELDLLDHRASVLRRRLRRNGDLPLRAMVRVELDKVEQDIAENEHDLRVLSERPDAILGMYDFSAPLYEEAAR